MKRLYKDIVDRHDLLKPNAKGHGTRSKGQGAMQEQSEKNNACGCVSESCEGEATAQQDRESSQTMKGRIRRFKPSGKGKSWAYRAGPRPDQNMAEEPRHGTNTVQATYRSQR